MLSDPVLLLSGAQPVQKHVTLAKRYVQGSQCLRNERAKPFPACFTPLCKQFRMLHVLPTGALQALVKALYYEFSM